MLNWSVKELRKAMEGQFFGASVVDSLLWFKQDVSDQESMWDGIGENGQLLLSLMDTLERVGLRVVLQRDREGNGAQCLVAKPSPLRPIPLKGQGLTRTVAVADAFMLASVEGLIQPRPITFDHEGRVYEKRIRSTRNMRQLRDGGIIVYPDGKVENAGISECNLDGVLLYTSAELFIPADTARAGENVGEQNR